MPFRGIAVTIGFNGSVVPNAAQNLGPIPSAETADLHSSSDEYARRFSGEIGHWMLDVQERITLGLLNSDTLTVLDVGGGHGQIAVPLANAHRSVTVLGSSHECAARLEDQIEKGIISFRAGNLLELPFPDRSFDTVVCFRLLSHCTRWDQLISEMCRVAQSCVIIDYPVWSSVNILSPLLFHLKKRVEGNTRTFELFSVRQVNKAFKKHGFVAEVVAKQFVLPMALHRMLKNRALSDKLEGICRTFGLTRLFGSPVIAKMSRRSL